MEAGRGGQVGGGGGREVGPAGGQSVRLCLEPRPAPLLPCPPHLAGVGGVEVIDADHARLQLAAHGLPAPLAAGEHAAAQAKGAVVGQRHLRQSEAVRLTLSVRLHQGWGGVLGGAHTLEQQQGQRGQRTASSSVVKGMTHMTGPNTSSVQICRGAQRQVTSDLASDHAATRCSVQARQARWQQQRRHSDDRVPVPGQARLHGLVDVDQHSGLHELPGAALEACLATRQHLHTGGASSGLHHSTAQHSRGHGCRHASVNQPPGRRAKTRLRHLGTQHKVLLAPHAQRFALGHGET